MGSKMRLVRGAYQTRKCRLVALIAGFFFVTMTFLVVSKPGTLVLLPNFGFRTSLSSPQPGRPPVNLVNSLPHLVEGIRRSYSATHGGGRDALNSRVFESNDERDNAVGEENNDISDSTPKQEASGHEIKRESGKDPDRLTVSQDTARIALPTVSNHSTVDRTLSNSSAVPNHSDSGGQNSQTPERKPLCDVSNPRIDICEMNGDVRIDANSSSVILVQASRAEPQEQRKVHPYPRKEDETCISRVKQLTVRTSSEGPRCTVTHAVPAVVFSVDGYTGNLFHDFTDLLVPLFATVRHLNGEVRFVVTDWKQWWLNKYRFLLQKLTNYPLINFDGVDQVHCFGQATVGLRAHLEFRIDPKRTPNGYTNDDFARFMRSAFSLEREALNSIEDLAGRKPRLMIIARKWSRAFTNIEEIVAMAEGLGYEVVVEEADVSSDMARFARIVNSCDVMMGVHGAGLTNLVFMPTNATLIQIVPWGGLESIAMLDFGNPAKDMGLNYMQYSIRIEESTLTAKYPRDHRVFTDPYSFHGHGFQAVRSTFMKQQNVKLDVKRFRDVLWKAFEHLIQ